MKIITSIFLFLPLIGHAQLSAFLERIQISPTASITYSFMGYDKPNDTYTGQVKNKINWNLGIEMLLIKKKRWHLAIEPNVNYYTVDVINYGFLNREIPPLEGVWLLRTNGTIKATALFIQMVLSNKFCFGKNNKQSFNLGVEYKGMYRQQNSYQGRQTYEYYEFGELVRKSTNRQFERYIYFNLHDIGGFLSFETRNLFQLPFSAEVGWSQEIIPPFNNFPFKIRQFFFKMKYHLN